MPVDKEMAVASRLMTGRCYPYIYEIGYRTYEESQHWQYSHRTKFTSAELNRHVTDALFSVLEYCSEHLDEEGFNQSLHILDNGPRFSDVMSHLKFHECLKRKGFVEVEYTHRFGVFGWASCLDPEDWNQNSTPLREKVCEELRKRCEESGIRVEPFEIPREKEDVENDIKDRRKRGQDEEDIRKAVGIMDVYHRIVKGER